MFKWFKENWGIVIDLAGLLFFIAIGILIVSGILEVHLEF